MVRLVSPLLHRCFHRCGFAHRRRRDVDRKARSGGDQQRENALVVGVVGVYQNSDAGNARRYLLEHPEQLCSETRLHDREAGHVAARVSEAPDPAVRDWIAAANEDDRNGLGQLLRRFGCRIAVGVHHVRRLTQELGGGGSYPFGVARAPVKVDLKISADVPTDLFEFPLECPGAQLSLRIALGVQHEHADPTGRRGLLCMGDERGSRGCATKYNDKLAPSHCLPKALNRVLTSSH